MIKEFQDPVFGQLKRTIHWHGKVNLPAMDNPVPISISTFRKQPPAEYQRRIFQEFLDAFNCGLIDRMKSAVYEAYKQRRENKQLTKSFDETVISDEERAWGLLHDMKLNIPSQIEHHRKCLFVMWKAPWLDDEWAIIEFWERGEVTFNLDDNNVDEMTSGGTAYK